MILSREAQVQREASIPVLRGGWSATGCARRLRSGVLVMIALGFMACSHYDERYENQLRGGSLNGTGPAKGVPGEAAPPDDSVPLQLALTEARYEGTFGPVEAVVDAPIISYSNGAEGTWITLDGGFALGSMVILNLPFDLALIEPGRIDGDGASVTGCSGLSTNDPWDSSAAPTLIRVNDEPGNGISLDFEAKLNNSFTVQGTVSGELR